MNPEMEMQTFSPFQHSTLSSLVCGQAHCGCSMTMSHVDKWSHVLCLLVMHVMASAMILSVLKLIYPVHLIPYTERK